MVGIEMLALKSIAPSHREARVCFAWYGRLVPASCASTAEMSPARFLNHPALGGEIQTFESFMYWTNPRTVPLTWQELYVAWCHFLANVPWATCSTSFVL